MVTPGATDHLLDPRTAAEWLGCSRRTIYRRVADGSLPALKLAAAANSPIRVRASDLVRQLHLPNKDPE